MGKQNVALVAGATGIVGEALTDILAKRDTAGEPWKVYALARRPRPSWLCPEAVYVQCDLQNKNDVLAKLSPLTDVTHVFWVTWVSKATEAENSSANGLMFQNALDAILPNAKNLQHIVLQTGTKQYTGSFDASQTGKGIVAYDTPFTEDLPRQACLNFYHTLEDILYEAVKKTQGKVTWSVHRPNVIFGLAAGSLMNFLGTLGVYGAICKHEGLPFLFPGNQFMWDSTQDASNSDLIAEQEVWAATDPRGKNQAFNCSNGDVFRWKKVWKSLADKLGVEYVPYNGQPSPLSESMKGMESVWDKIIQENGLYHSKLEDVAHWWFADWILNNGSHTLSSMNKSKELGFLGFRNTEKTMLSLFDQMRARKLIP